MACEPICDELACESLSKVESDPQWTALEPTQQLRVAWYLGFEAAIDQCLIELRAKNKHDAADELKKLKSEFRQEQ